MRTLAAALAAALAFGAGAQEITVYRGMCDASAAVALDDVHFVVADDEDNTLRVYRRRVPQPVATVPLAKALGTTKESDLEGAARIGDAIYWISSHARNARGDVRADRYRLFVTRIDRSASPPVVTPPAAMQTQLLAQLIATDAMRPWQLREASRLAAEAPGGLNIEGLAATADGKLLIGFRNPLREGKALVVALENPQAAAAGAAATFGPPIGLDLGGRGVRSIERLEEGYLIVAGPVADQGDFALYRWIGSAGEEPRPVTGITLGSLRPEALFVWPGSRRVQLLSDDGGVVTAGVACKDRPASTRSFRSIELEL